MEWEAICNEKDGRWRPSFCLYIVTLSCGSSSVSSSKGSQDQKQKAEEGYQRYQQGGQVGHGGGGQNGLRAGKLVLGQDSLFQKHSSGSAAGVVFHRQGDESEQNREAIQEHAGHGKAVAKIRPSGGRSAGTKQQPDQNQRDRQSGAKIDHRNNGCSQPIGEIPVLVLGHMTDLVGGHGNGGNGRTAAGAFGEIDDVFSGMIVVRQQSADLPHRDIRDLICRQQTDGGVVPGHTGGAADLVVFGVGLLHLSACRAGEKKTHQHCCQVKPMMRRIKQVDPSAFGQFGNSIRKTQGIFP